MSTTTSSSPKILGEEGSGFSANAGRRSGMSGRKESTSNGSIYRLPAASHPHAPIYGASPNNAEHEQIYYSSQPTPSAHHHSHSQEPQTTQGRPRLGTSSLTGSPTALGPQNSADIPGSQASNGSADDHPGSKEVRNPRSVGAPRPSHIDLNDDNHHSRDTRGSGVKVKNSAAYFEGPRTHSPENYRRSPTTSGRQWLNKVPEEMEVPSSSAVADGNATYSDQQALSTAGHSHQYYGSVGHGPPPHTRNDVDPGVGPRYVEGVLIDDDDASSLSSEEEEWLLDEELAKEGLYRGNYKNLVILYTLVPFSTLLVFVLLVLLPVLAFPSSSHSLFPYPPYLLFPIPEVVTAMALWSLSYLIRNFLYSTSLVVTSAILFHSYRFSKFIPVLTSILSAFLQSISAIFLRQLAIPLLLVPYYSTERRRFFLLYSQQDLQQSHFPTWHDDAFRRVWWVALGWAAAEAVVGIKQGYESIALYKDVLVDMKVHPKNQAERASTREENVSTRDMHRTSSINLPDIRVATPTQLHPAKEDHNMDSTPTQRDWPTRQRTSDANHQHIVSSASVSERRDYSGSLSSLSTRSDPRNEPLLDSVSDVARERQPLLKLNHDPLPLTRQQTDESQRLLVENAVERDLEELIALKTREELEEVYGIPVIRIPVFISCLHRINSILFSLGICLILSAAYMKSAFAYHPSSIDPSFPPVPPPLHPSNRLLWITVPPLIALQTLLAMMHTPWVLPKIGIHTFVYISLLASLGVFFGGLGIWEVLT